LTRGTPEAAIQRAIVQALRLALPPGTIVHASCHEVRGSSDRARRMQEIHKGMGAMPGFPDLIVLASGRVLFLEVKTPRGHSSEAQRRFAMAAEGQGHGYAVVRSVADALAALAAHGIEHRRMRVQP
jgi:hypothetical protein